MLCSGKARLAPAPQGPHPVCLPAQLPHQDVAGLQQLTRLQLAVQAARQPEHGGPAQVRVADWAALRPLSRLARLQVGASAGRWLCSVSGSMS